VEAGCWRSGGGGPVLVQERPGLLDRPADGGPVDAEQLGQQGVGEGEVLVKEGGQDPVGERQFGRGAGSGCPLPVAAAPLVPVLFPLCAPWACQRGGQIVQVVAGQPGQRGVGQCGAVPSGGGLWSWGRGPPGLARVRVRSRGRCR
jgi:hypothetical protein